MHVPEYLLDLVTAETNSEGDRDLAKLKPCCRQRALAARAAKNCGNSGQCAAPPVDDPPVVPGILAIHALKCQGSSLSLSLLPPSIPMDEIDTQLLLIPGEKLVLSTQHFYQPPCFDAVVPPPEFAAL